jgi:hypothetical protein
MTKRSLLRFLCLALLPAAARAQAVENYFQFGAAFGSTQVIGGSNVTVTGSTGFSNTVGLAFQVVRKSAASLWVEPFSPLFATPGGSASIQGSATANVIIWTPSVRLMLPVQPRISVFGAVGAGGGRFHNYTLNSDNPPQLATYADYHGVFSAGGGIDFRIARHVSIRVDARDYVTGRGLGGVLGRNHFLPMAGIALHY